MEEQQGSRVSPNAELGATDAVRGSCQSGAHTDGILYLKSMVPALRKFYNRRIRKKLCANQECVVGRKEVYGMSCRC